MRGALAGAPFAFSGLVTASPDFRDRGCLRRVRRVPGAKGQVGLAASGDRHLAAADSRVDLIARDLDALLAQDFDELSDRVGTIEWIDES